MLHFVRSTLTPAAYHGHHQKPPFFEGRYFKLVSPDRRQRWAIIPGIFKHRDPAEAHTFATYNGARVESLAVAPQHVEWTLRNRTHRLQIRAHRR